MSCGIWPRNSGVGIALRLFVEDGVTTTGYTQSRGVCVWGGDVVVCFGGLVSPLFGDLA